MKKKRLCLAGSVVLVLFVAFAFVLSPVTAAAAEKVYRMKIQSGYPHGDLSMELL